jgi:hypothetical protein
MIVSVLDAIKKLYNQLQGRRFTIFTDHSALVYLFNACTTDHKLQRWADILMSLDFEVVHIRGNDNTRPDALSRLGITAISSLNQIGLSQEQLIRDKTSPDSELAKRKLKMRMPMDTLEIEDAHAYGHFGHQLR